MSLRTAPETPTRTAVYLLIFNRPETTARVFEAIAAARPARLFVFADGPRPEVPEDEKGCRKARAVVDRVDWPCDVRRRFSTTNLGCAGAMPAGLDWVFDQTDAAIILEDDCLPHPSFFAYCDELLERYREDPRILHVGGNNFQGGRRRGRYSYYFSKYAHIWGWATWRRAWRLYDPAASSWPQAKATGALRGAYGSDEEYAHWVGIFDRIHARELTDTWDYAWSYCCFTRGLSVTPNVNLVSNIGFGSGTHTLAASPLGNMRTADVRPITHPPEVACDQEADRFTFANVVSPDAPVFKPRIPVGVRARTRYWELRKRLRALIAGARGTA